MVYKYEYCDRVFEAPDPEDFDPDEYNEMDPLQNGDWSNKTVITMPFDDWNESLLQQHPPDVKFYLTSTNTSQPASTTTS